ncbi:hypothetical protein [Nocardioides coralli]|uniref:hypothetical protein n=1 Tax=Nocardioides coralli TaxID=2872154 RepID=UPI001CA3F1E6|nr:hypothetical protein [Nocardioides coralli]QZY29758.1 hypothetical protein K6T13_03430 [Nocardioides coralli]
MTRRPDVALALAVAATSAVLVACGAQPPSDSVPSLVDHVADVDSAVVAGDEQAAREALSALVSDAEQAAADGVLAQDDADAIVASAQALLDRLAEPEPRDEPAEVPASEEPDPSGGEETQDKQQQDTGEDEDDEEDDD